MANRLNIDFKKTFLSGSSVQIRLDCDFDASPVQVIFGPSGSGKSTLLRTLAGLDDPSKGHIRFRDELWFQNGTTVSPQLRRAVYLSQKPALFPHLTVAENIRYGRYSEGPLASQLTKLFEIAGLENRYPNELSGGQSQRVSLARAIASKPKLLLLDEPFSALDFTLKISLRNALLAYLKKENIPTVIVTHDLKDAGALGDQIHLLDQGQVLQSGLTSSLLKSPRSLRAALILGYQNQLLSQDSVITSRPEETKLVPKGQKNSTPVVIQNSADEGGYVRTNAQTLDHQFMSVVTLRSTYSGELPKSGDEFGIEYLTPPLIFGKNQL